MLPITVVLHRRSPTAHYSPSCGFTMTESHWQLPASTVSMESHC